MRIDKHKPLTGTFIFLNALFIILATLGEDTYLEYFTTYSLKYFDMIIPYKFIVFGSILGLLVSIIFFLITYSFFNSKKYISQFCKGLYHSSFFHNDNDIDSRYRITLYRLSTPEDKFQHFINFIKVNFRIIKENRLSSSNNKKNYMSLSDECLIQYYRYGYEGQNQITNTSSTFFLINSNKGIYEGYVGLVYSLGKNQSMTSCAEDINENVKKLKKYLNIHDYNSLNTVEKDIKKLQLLKKDNKIDISIENIIDFMDNTNTNLYNLINIKKHAQCFLGLKIYYPDKYGPTTINKVWGVMITDALSTKMGASVFEEHSDRCTSLISATAAQFL